MGLVWVTGSHGNTDGILSPLINKDSPNFVDRKGRPGEPASGPFSHA